MDFALTDEQQLLLDTAQRFVREQLGLKPAEQRPDPAAIWRQLGDMGWLALPLPEDVGGLGGSFEDLIILMTAMGRGVVSPPIVANMVLCGHLLAACAPNELAVALLERLACGASQVAFADRDSGEAAVAATIAADGDYVISGCKTLSHGAPQAESLLVTAHLEHELAVFLIETSTPGVSIETYPLMHGDPAGDVRLSQVKVPSERLMLTGLDATAVRAEALDRAVLANLAQAVGCLEAALETSVDYVKVREQFGQPIGAFQAIKHILSRMYVDAQEARSILYYGLSKIDAEPVERAKAIASARLVVSEAARNITEEGIQLHGGYGVTDEYEISHYYRKAMTLSLMFRDPS